MRHLVAAAVAVCLVTPAGAQYERDMQVPSVHVRLGRLHGPQDEVRKAAQIARVRVTEERALSCGYIYKAEVTELFRGKRGALEFFAFRPLAPVARGRDFLIFAYRPDNDYFKKALQLGDCKPAASLYLGYQFDSFMAIDKTADGKEIVRFNLHDPRRSAYGLVPCIRRGGLEDYLVTPWTQWRTDLTDIVQKKKIVCAF